MTRSIRTLLTVATVTAGSLVQPSGALAADGALDTRFSGDGKLTLTNGSDASIADVAAFGDGRLAVVGDFAGFAEVAVLKRDGSLDPGFSADGLASVPFDPTRIAVGDGGTVVVAGQGNPFGSPSNIELEVARLDATGAPDASFGGGDGLTETVLGRDLDDLAVDSAGRIVVVGSFESNADFEVTRFDATGALDNSFSGDGMADFNVSTLSSLRTQLESAEAVAIQPDDKIVVAGGVDVSAVTKPKFVGSSILIEALEGSFAVIRVTTGGALDTSFASGTGRSYPNVVTGESVCERTGGTPSRCSNELESAKSVAIEPDGQIAVAGFTDSDPDADVDIDDIVEDQEIDFAVAHLNANGSSDTGFSGDGRVSTAISPNNPDTFFDRDEAVGVVAGPNGTVIAAGNARSETTSRDFAFVRYLDNGSLDPAFDGASSGNGKFTVTVQSPSSTPEAASSAALLPNGNVALAGTGLVTNTYGALAVVRNDGLAPNTQITSGPAEGSTVTTNTVSFSFSAIGEPGITTFECSYGGGINPQFVDCGSPYVKALPDGPKTFRVRAVDPAGNVDPSAATRSFTVDANPPDTILTANPGAFTADTTPGFSFSSVPPGATFQCALATGHALAEIPQGSFGACSGAGTHTPAALADGEYTFAVRASSPGGTDPTPATFEFELDTDAPNGTIVAGPSGPTSDATPSFQVTTDEPLDIPEGEFAMTCALSGPATPSVDCDASPSFTYPALPDGNYTMTLTVQDLLGRQDPTPATRSFRVDTAAPGTSIASGPAEGAAIRDTTPTFSFATGAGEPAGTIFQCRLAPVQSQFSPCSSPHTTAALADGPKTLSVRAVDAAGNIDPTPATRSFRVDTAAPGTSIASGPAEGAAIRDTTPTFSFATGAGEPAGTTFQCRLAPVQSQFSPCSSPHTTAALADGPKTLSVRAVDAAGNVDPTPATRSFRVDTVAPETSITRQPPARTERRRARIGFNSSEGQGRFQCKLDAGVFESCVSPVLTDRLSLGRHVFRVRAIDLAGNRDTTPAIARFRIVPRSG